MSKYQKCPVCGGNGIVPGDFYLKPVDYPYSMTGTAVETCRTCNGRGIILAPDSDNDCYEWTYHESSF